MSSNVETFQFQAEARQVLELMIHSLYTNKEIFIRELISNASDAIDRLRFEALSNPELIGEDDRYEIVIESDPKAKTLTIHDNGIGMSREEVIAKARDLMNPVLGTNTTTKLIDTIFNLESIKNVRDLRPMLQRG